MPIDQMYTGPMLDPFRNMMRDVESKGLTGPDVDAMRAALDEMESLALELSDYMEYSGQLTQRQTFARFSDAYSRALAAAAAPKAGQAAPGDESLLRTTLEAYEQTLVTYESGAAGEEMKEMIPVVREIIALGRSGVSYPVFLRTMEERGLGKVLDGSNVVVREGLQESIRMSRESWARYDIIQGQRELELFDDLAGKAPFGVPEPLEFNLGCRHIAWELEPERRLWSAIVSRFEMMLDLLVDWLDSFAGFAPYDPRWKGPGSTPAQVRHAIERTQECGPGFFRYREAIFHEYFGLKWPDIWRHEAFTWQYTANQISHSDERLRLVWETYPQCRPGARPDAALVARTEDLRARKADVRAEHGFPPPDKPLAPFDPTPRAG